MFCVHSTFVLFCCTHFRVLNGWLIACCASKCQSVRQKLIHPLLIAQRWLPHWAYNFLVFSAIGTRRPFSRLTKRTTHNTDHVKCQPSEGANDNVSYDYDGKKEQMNVHFRGINICFVTALEKKSKKTDKSVPMPKGNCLRKWCAPNWTFFNANECFMGK